MEKLGLLVFPSLPCLEGFITDLEFCLKQIFGIGFSLSISLPRLIKVEGFCHFL